MPTCSHGSVDLAYIAEGGGEPIVLVHGGGYTAVWDIGGANGWPSLIVFNPQTGEVMFNNPVQAAPQGPSEPERFAEGMRRLGITVSPEEIKRKYGMAAPERAPTELQTKLQVAREMGASDEQLDFPVLYGSGKMGWMSKQYETPTSNMDELFQLVVDHVPQPKVAEGPFRFLATTISADPFLGRILTGRILSGTVKPM